MAGALVGLVVAIFYKYLFGDLTFAVSDIANTAAEKIPTFQLSQLTFFIAALSCILLGAVIGFIIDKQIGLKFLPKTKMIMWIIGGILVIYLFQLTSIQDQPGADSTRQSLSRGAGPTSPITPGFGGSVFALLNKLSPFWLATLFYGVISGFFGLIKSIVAPTPAFPIWIFFVAGFFLLLILRRKGGGEQPIIIQR